MSPSHRMPAPAGAHVVSLLLVRQALASGLDWGDSGLERTVASYHLDYHPAENAQKAYDAYAENAGFDVRLSAREIYLYEKRFVKGMAAWVHDKGWGKYLCKDMQPAWQSPYGTNCAKYLKHHWCMSDGRPGPTWLPKWGSFANWSVNGIDATQACCACGGGTTEDTESHMEAPPHFMTKEKNNQWFDGVQKLLDDEWPVATERDVKDINAKDVGWTAGIPVGGDEVAQKDLDRLCGVKIPKETMAMLQEQALLQEEADTNSSAHIPSSLDARTQWPKCSGVVSHVRDQGQCGSCWAQAAAGAVEGRICIESDGAFSGDSAWISAGHLTSCSKSNGCSGGDPRKAYEWMAANGVPTGADYRHRKSGQSCVPYFTAGNALEHFEASKGAPSCPSSCTDKKFPRSMQQDKFFTTKGQARYLMKVSQAKEELQKGPIVLAFKVFKDFMSYKGGIYTPTTNKISGMHGTTAIGYGPGYILAMNSWGSTWGDKGSFKMSETCCGMFFVTAGKVPATKGLPLPGGSPSPSPSGPSPSPSSPSPSPPARKSAKPATPCPCESSGLSWACCGDGICSGGSLGPETSLNCPVDCQGPSPPPPPPDVASNRRRYVSTEKHAHVHPTPPPPTPTPAPPPPAPPPATKNRRRYVSSYQSRKTTTNRRRYVSLLQGQSGAVTQGRRRRRKTSKKKKSPPSISSGSTSGLEGKVDRIEAKIDSLSKELEKCNKEKSAPSPSPSPAPVPTPSKPLTFKEQVLDLHNAFRCMHNTPFLAWDAELASEANKIASKGVYQLSTIRQRFLRGQILGESIGKGPDSSATELVVRGWYKQTGSTTYGQLLWAATTRVGCAEAGGMLVCRYGVNGNIAGQYTRQVRPIDSRRSEFACMTAAGQGRPAPLGPAPTQYCGKAFTR